ncbi:PadR family transcriptional regulator [Metabacillus fastidiosus]|uniref:Helix-turn-helix transcriptional regulator n=1 Tax=Metabacillus fastidiosus TaxID=1458 RepID=A0ABU6P0N9_9BACI|nr:helix-turn-helix transcriptional regulator [Metabacillus fastidiosus]MEC2076461.1 helix-turn-helix transcriptional regulator [Metabacillus fastidiosus]MED4402927.1 helix-turn-helix transcriptional regulator [Metabacillus fastidiosus]MED4454284.1 helix-turn-helix transcriptional regulator [Metabacillus fastidiosus]MED4461345.1 helix-turn-helix transcriptional regulator [Metabacillus fastidiosus]MED4533921.1 helix-turn-helix transcriptional regulator [Metabacillus fastidiosus]
MFDRELVKGSTSIIVLQLLNERDMYGYELVKEMEKRSENTLTVKEGTLYPALHKLEQKGYVEAYWQEQEKGPARKYYRILKEGKAILAEKTKEWGKFVKMMNGIIGRDAHDSI